MSKDVRKNEKIIRIICTTVLALVAIFWMLPVVWVLTNSFKTNLEFQTSYTNFSSRMEYVRAMFPKKFRRTFRCLPARVCPRRRAFRE